MAPPERFRFAFDPRYRRFAAPLGITPATAWVDLGDELDARFGAWRLRTPRANVVGAEVTGPYGFWKTAGPAHLSFSDRGLTFATNGRRGVCVRFAEPVAGIDPLGLVRHPALTLTVEDPDRLASLVG